MGVFYQFDSVDKFGAATVGRPGQRTFFLKVDSGSAQVTIKCEKQQVAGIAEFLRRILNDLPAVPPRPGSTNVDVDSPINIAFVLGSIGLGYDRDTNQIVVQLEEAITVDENGEIDPEAADDQGRVRLLIDVAHALAYCQQAEQLVSAGRPPCAFCGRPAGADGHVCPKMN